MATPYDNIFARFTQKITDYRLAGMTNEVLEEHLLGYLNSAVVKFTECRNDLTRNQTLMQFNYTLTEIEEEVIACLMILEWLQPYINNILALEPHLTDNEFKTYSEANGLNSKLNLKTDTKNEIKLLISRYSWDKTLLNKLR